MTRSTDILLSMAGYSTRHFPKFHAGDNLMEAVRGLEGDPDAVVERLMPLLRDRDAFSDVPVPGLYRGLAARWPDSRFILVTRDPADWARSVRGHLRRRRLSPFNEIQYRPYLGPTGRRAREITLRELEQMHERHREAVSAFFRSELGEPERLCVVDGTRDGAGERICEFLGVAPRPMPRVSGREGDGELATAHEWVAQRPDKQEAHYLLARNWLRAGELEAAEASARQAIRAEPDQPKPHALLSDILLERESPHEAWRCARRALDLGLVQRRLRRRVTAGLAREGRWLAASRCWFRGLRA
jgi:hypothetical protein